LPSTLSIQAMWKLFLEQYKDDENAKMCKYSLYSTVFKTQFNLGFGTPRTDVCSICENFGHRIKSEQDEKIRKNMVCELMLHKRRAKKFYELLSETVPENTACFVFDMMQNQPLPRTALGEAFYARQLWQYYLGIIRHYGGKSRQEKKDVYFYTWSEHESTRGSNEICSALHQHLRKFCADHPQIKLVKLFCDACSAQNKNYTMLAMLSKLATFGVKFEITFPVRGHSFLPADRAFGRVEKLLRTHEQLLLPNEYNAIYDSVGTVQVLGKDWNVFDWKGTSKGHIKSKMDFKITEMKVMTLASNEIGCKTTYTGEPCYHKILKRGKKWSSLTPRKIPLANTVKSAKVADVKSLLSKMGISAEHAAMEFYNKVISFSSDVADNDASDKESEVE
jgi:hypothetical protein